MGIGLIEIFAVSFLLDAEEIYFLKDYKRYLPRVLKDIFLKRALPKYEEYIRNINNIDIKLEFFIFPKLKKPSSKMQKTIDSIVHFRGSKVIDLTTDHSENVHINSYLTYYILRNIYKKFGKKIKDDKVGLIGIERAKKNGMLYEIAYNVDVIYAFEDTYKFEKISEELLREFGTVLVKVRAKEEVLKDCSLCFVFDENEAFYNGYTSILCIPEKGIILDSLHTKKIITLDNTKIDFIPLRDIIILNNPLFCSIPVNLIGVLCEKILLTTIDSFSYAKSVFTKDYFNVKIHFI